MSYTRDFYRQLPTHPPETTAANVMVRMFDAIGFRLWWALEGLREEDCDYSPCDGAKSIGEIVTHIWDLMNWISRSYDGQQRTKPMGPLIHGAAALEMAYEMRTALLGKSNEALEQMRLRDTPFWNFVSAPMADALTHIGQINVLRRAAGNPAAFSTPLN